jgi:hypothetical protein
MSQRDLVLRWIEQVVRTVQRMLLGPGPIDFTIAQDRIEEAMAQLLGPLALLVPRLEVPSAAELLRDADRIAAVAELLDLQAALEDVRGKPEAARESRTRARAFREAASRRETETSG